MADAAERFAYPIVETPGARALETWRALKASGRGVPIVLGGPGDLAAVADGVERARKRGRTPQRLLKAADRLRFPAALDAWLEQERKKAEAFFRRSRIRLPPPDAEDDEALPREGPWPDAVYPSQPLSLALTIDRESLKPGEPARLVPFETVFIALLPAADAAEAPAWLGWGGWNAVPPPEILVAALRSWRDRFGAELAGVSGAAFSLSVERPPPDRDAALALARELARVCPTALGEGTYQELAAELMGEWWGLWWD